MQTRLITTPKSLWMSLLIILVSAALISCSKTESAGGGATPIDPPKVYGASFKSQPDLTPDTLDARTPGAMSLSFDHTTAVESSLGNVSSDKSTVSIPGQEKSTSCTVTLTGEDGVKISKTVPVPVYDTVISMISQKTTGWEIFSDVTVASTGGSTTGTLDHWKFIYYKIFDATGKRTGMVIKPNGTTTTGHWTHLDEGAQFNSGTEIWNNIKITPTYWEQQRSWVSGGVTYTRTIKWQ